MLTDDVICWRSILHDNIPEPEIPCTGSTAVSCGDVMPEPEVIVEPVDNASNLRSRADEQPARQYLYDDIEGHYSPAGRGYPHGFHHLSSPVGPADRDRSGRRSPDADDRDHVVPGFSVP